jgi:alkyl hydroperoxide reductase subunit F
MLYDIIILGGGPAGCSAAVYAARKGLSTLLITDTFGGQSIVSETIYNWIGTPELSGHALAESLASHVEYYKSNVTIQKETFVTSITKNESIFTVTGKTHTGEITFQSKTILYALGSKRRTLDIPGAKEFEHKGLTYCASCDGPLFSGQPVVVIGGGNAGFESALQLLAYCSSVTLLNRSGSFRADAVTVESALAHPNFTSVQHAIPLEVYGEKFVNALSYSVLGEVTKIEASGIFVEIGQLPNTEPAKELDPDLLDIHGKIVIDPTRGSTSVPGFWAAGDCTNCIYHQNNIAAGDAVRALEDLYIWLKKQPN